MVLRMGNIKCDDFHEFSSNLQGLFQKLRVGARDETGQILKKFKG